MRIAICDDEKTCLDTMQKEVSAYAMQSNRSFQIDLFLSANKLLVATNSLQFDVIFLDISMPEMNGLDLARQIRSVDADVQIVFITNMANEMPNGYNVMASGFIIKPIIRQTLFDVLNRVVFQYERKRIPPYEVKLKGGQNGMLDLQDVLYLESRLHNILAVCKKTELEYRGELARELVRLIPYGFAQIHRSYLVNMAWVWIVTDNAVTFTNNKSLPIGAKFLSSFKEIYRKYRRGGLN